MHKILCNGVNRKHAVHHKNLADFHFIMSKFYKLCKKDQLIFLSTFKEMIKGES